MMHKTLLILICFLIFKSLSAQDFIFKKDKIFFGDKELSKSTNFGKVFGKPDRTESNENYEQFYYDDLQFSYINSLKNGIHLNLYTFVEEDFDFFTNDIFFNEIKIDPKTHLYKLLRIKDFAPFKLGNCDTDSCYLEFLSDNYRIVIMYQPNYHIQLLTVYL